MAFGIWHLAMVGQSRKWMIIIATTWIQAFTGTNFDFSTYSSTLKSVLGISQVQLNYLSVASDMGKALGWCCGVCLMHFPSWIVMFIATFMGLFGYGLQWLVIQKLIVLPYFMVSLPFNLSFFFSVSLVFSHIIVKWVCLFPFFSFFFLLFNERIIMKAFTVLLACMKQAKLWARYVSFLKNYEHVVILFYAVHFILFLFSIFSLRLVVVILFKHKTKTKSLFLLPFVILFYYFFKNLVIYFLGEKNDGGLLGKLASELVSYSKTNNTFSFHV